MVRARKGAAAGLQGQEGDAVGKERERNLRSKPAAQPGGARWAKGSRQLVPQQREGPQQRDSWPAHQPAGPPCPQDGVAGSSAAPHSSGHFSSDFGTHGYSGSFRHRGAVPGDGFDRQRGPAVGPKRNRNQ
jgi:hypothetical protein